MTMWLKGGAAGSVKANWVCEIVCTSVSTGRPETMTPNIVGTGLDDIGRTLGQLGGGVKRRFCRCPWRVRVVSGACLSINVTQEPPRRTKSTSEADRSSLLTTVSFKHVFRIQFCIKILTKYCPLSRTYLLSRISPKFDQKYQAKDVSMLLLFIDSLRKCITSKKNLNMLRTSLAAVEFRQRFRFTNKKR